MTTEDRSSCTSIRESLGLSFTIDYLLFNKGVKGSKEEATISLMAVQTANDLLNHQNPKPKEVGIRPEIQEKQLQRSEVDSEGRNVKEEEGDEVQQEGEEDVMTTTTKTTTSIRSASEESANKPNQSYITLISEAILASRLKKLLLCDIYQWIMDHYPYFKSKDKNWRNSVRHNLSLNDCFIKAGRSDDGRGHFWAIHPSNYQNFSNGDYHCRRVRRRARRVSGQPPLSSLSSSYHPALTHPHLMTCWCCHPGRRLPLSCSALRHYCPCSCLHQQMHLHLGLQASVH
ncbi:forkhead box Q2 [Solea solea]|uniref:forkhead box Q2 n=1 Tax=Solea solea TaxID=90069 RepID=UPI002729C068|nr:forkhead box Q2 [Solea solea]